MSDGISDKLWRWCTATPSVTELLAEDPQLTPAKAVKKLFREQKALQKESTSEKDPRTSTSSYSSRGSSAASESAEYLSNAPSQEELDRALQCGKFGEQRPSELFTRMWYDALSTLEHDPLAGSISPSLMGTSGTIPLTAIGTVWDVCAHMSNLVVRAEKEVYLATNYWMPSDASKLITDGFRELSRRAVKDGRKVVVKIIYDRGSAKQALRNHLVVSTSEYTSSKIEIPSPEEIPNVDVKVMNYHRPLLGTFHAKFMVVDRRFAVISSNNIQKNDNLEMMTHLEGPVVDSLYDVALISWSGALDPPLPCVTKSVNNTAPTFGDSEVVELFNEQGEVKAFTPESRLPCHTPQEPHYDQSIAGEIRRMESKLRPISGMSHMQLVATHLNESTQSSHPPTAPEPSSPSEFFSPYIPHPPHTPFPIAFVNRKPVGAPKNSSVHVPQNAAWLSGLRNAKSRVFIQTPNLNAAPLIPEILAAVKRGVEVEYWVSLGYNDAGELLPGQNGTNEMIAGQLRDGLRDEPEEIQRMLKIGWYVSKDQDRVVHKMEKGRSCHIKLMVVDNQVGIQGNGNQDTQSWSHSQEVNIMIDSSLICTSWMKGIRRNQNTHLFGMGSLEDGLWRDSGGNQAKEAIGKDTGRFSWAKGAFGAVQRVRGVGGF